MALRAGGTVGRFSATSVKIMQDGVCENFTGATIDPYLDEHGHPTDNNGLSMVDPELLKEAVTRLDALGFQVHFHALADRAVREALDAIEVARRTNGFNDLRHHLAHLQIVHPDDLRRFRQLGALANAQPLWAAHEAQMDELTIPFLGEPRWTWQYPFGSLVRQGATLVMGSDWPVSTPDPMAEMHVAVNRKMPADYAYRVENHDVFLPGGADRPGHLDGGVHDRLGLRESPRARHGLDRDGQARRPRGLRPQRVRPSRGGDLRREMPVDLRGRTAGLRGRRRLTGGSRPRLAPPATRAPDDAVDLHHTDKGGFTMTERVRHEPSSSEAPATAARPTTRPRSATGPRA